MGCGCGGRRKMTEKAAKELAAGEVKKAAKTATQVVVSAIRSARRAAGMSPRPRTR